MCNTSLSNAKLQHEVSHSIRFIIGLNDSFDMVHSHVLLMNRLPNINKIFSLVIQHERKIKVLIFDESKILINIVDYKKCQGRGRGNGFSFFGNKKVCTHYGENGHIVDTCYKKHGVTPHFGKGNVAANDSSLEEKDDDRIEIL